MKAIVKGTVISGAGALVLGVSLALSSAGVVSGASGTPYSRHVQPLATPTCNTSGYCLTESNAGTGGGIDGTTNGASAIGVYGSGSGSSSIGAKGVSTGSTGIGLEGVDTKSSGTGVFGHGGTGIFGEGNSAGVYAQEAATGGNAVYAVATGSGATGVLGESLTGDGWGVEGESSGRAGVYGSSSNGTGVSASGGATGLYASGGATGLYAVATGSGATGVYGIASGSGDTVAIVSETSSASGTPLEACGVATAIPSCFVTDAFGDGTFAGTVTASGFSTGIRERGGVRVRASVPLAPRATIEDSGTARLANGVGVVHLERDFASTIDSSKGYQVFLTPDGDTRGLYVAAKYEAGFIVREAEHGRSSIYFDYRILAHPAGSSDARFPIDDSKPPPRPKLPALAQRPPQAKTPALVQPPRTPGG